MGGAQCRGALFFHAAQQWQFLVPSPGLPTDAREEQALFAWSKEFADRCNQHSGAIQQHASSTTTARDLELLRRAVGDSKLTYHGISYGTQLGAIYANLFPSRVRAMVLRWLGRLRRQRRRSRPTRHHGPAEHPATYRYLNGRNVRRVLGGLFDSRPALRVLARRSEGQVGGAGRAVSPDTCHRLRPCLDLSRAGCCRIVEPSQLSSTG